MQSSKNKENLPQDTVIGTVATDELPRKSTFGTQALKWSGYIASVITSSLTRDIVSDIAKEDASAHEVVKGDGFGKAFKKGVNRALDTKLWKSNVAEWATLFGGILLTNFVVKKVEENKFKKDHGTLPRMDQINKILKGEFDDTTISDTAKTDWRDKTKKTEELQRTL